MNTLIIFLKQIVTTLVLKPFDWLLFGGSGALTRSKEEWRADYEAMRVVSSGSAAAEDVPDSMAMESSALVHPDNWGYESLILFPEMPHEEDTSP